MSKIFFRNSCNWKDAFAVIGDERIRLTERDADGDLSVDFDADKHTCLYFENGEGERTEKVYPGVLSIGVEFKKNERLDKNLTYLYSKLAKKTGRVDNFVFEDEKNLSYRATRSKKVSVFVPSGYDGATPHDILYFFDAQNLFCSAGDYTENGDPYGSWQLDVVLSEVYRQMGERVIVVAIDNSDKYRSQELFMDASEFGELTPLATLIPDDDYTNGKLDDLYDFMMETVHPFILEHYCVTESDIGIGGSSMGGIAALYCGLREVGFFKYVLSYSPAYGLYEMSAFDSFFEGKKFTRSRERLPKIHIYCGSGDQLEQMLMPSSMAMKASLVKYGYPESKIFETWDSEKIHNEEAWRLILPQSFTYLF